MNLVVQHMFGVENLTEMVSKRLVRMATISETSQVGNILLSFPRKFPG
jgi:hypothetical protein